MLLLLLSPQLNTIRKKVKSFPIHVVLISVSVTLSQTSAYAATLGYRARASRGMSVYVSAFTGTHTHTDWWQRHMHVNNLPKVVTQQCNNQGSNSRPVSHQPDLLPVDHWDWVTQLLPLPPINGYFPGESGSASSSQVLFHLFRYRMSVELVEWGCFTGQTFFLTPSHQWKSTEGGTKH